MQSSTIGQPKGKIQRAEYHSQLGGIYVPQMKSNGKSNSALVYGGTAQYPDNRREVIVPESGGAYFQASVLSGRWNRFF